MRRVRSLAAQLQPQPVPAEPAPAAAVVPTLAEVQAAFRLADAELRASMSFYIYKCRYSFKRARKQL